MLVALLALVAAAEPSADDFMERVNRPVALTVPGMDRVQVLPDRPYGPGDKAHRFDAYLPGRPMRGSRRVEGPRRGREKAEDEVSSRPARRRGV